mmetsp:Transcript_17321/g.43177  ORF Transcript_17321/g.43177 Transcript_17321/m.43177 type:complete len:811 (-) Transcript_17321:251-2683(-)
MSSILANDHRRLFQPNLTPSFLEESTYRILTNYLGSGAFGKCHAVDQRLKSFLKEAIDAEHSTFSEEVLEERAKVRTQKHRIDGMVLDPVVPKKVRGQGWSQESEMYLDVLEPHRPPRHASLEVYLGAALHLVRSGEGQMLYDYLHVFKHNEPFKYTLMVSALLLERWDEFKIVASFYQNRDQRQQLCRKSYLDAVRARPDSGLWERMERAAVDASTGDDRLFGMHSLIVPLSIRIAWGDLEGVRNCLTGRLCGYTEPRTEQLQTLLSHPWCRPVVEEIVSGKHLTQYFGDAVGKVVILLCDYDKELTLLVLGALSRRTKSLPSNMEQIATKVRQRLVENTATPALYWLIQYLIQSPRCVPFLRTYRWQKIMATMEDDLPLTEDTKSLFLLRVGPLLPPQDSLAVKLISQMETGSSPWENEEGEKYLEDSDLVMRVFALVFEHMWDEHAEEVLSQTVSALITHLFRARHDLPPEEYEVVMDRYVDLCVSLINDHCSDIAVNALFVERICYLFVFAVDLTPWQITIYENPGPLHYKYTQMLRTYHEDDPNRWWIRRRCMVRNGGKLVGLAIFLAVFLCHPSLARSIASSARMSMGRNGASQRDDDVVAACMHTLDATKSRDLRAKDRDAFYSNCVEPTWSPKAVSLFEYNNLPFGGRFDGTLQDAAAAVMMAMGRDLHRIFEPWLSPTRTVAVKTETGERVASEKRKLHHGDQCPITLEPFQVGDEVVVCEGCSMGFSIRAFAQCAALYIGQRPDLFSKSFKEKLNTSWCCCRSHSHALSRFRVYRLPPQVADADDLPLHTERSSKRARKE